MGNLPGPGPQWRKSSYSTGGGDDCVELAAIDRTIGIRDSKNPGGPRLSLTREGLSDLITAIKTG